MFLPTIRHAAASIAVSFLVLNSASADFINFETPQVHPVDINPGRTRLAVCNTADNRIEIFDISSGAPIMERSIPVGLDPVSVRFRTDSEVWAVNQISDSVSVINLDSGAVTHTVPTLDEPADVIFAGTPSRAYVSCSQADTVLVINPLAPTSPATEIAIEGEDPRALAKSADGSLVYLAIFESGNRSTILAGGGDGVIISSPENAVNHISGPYGGQNPPPNLGVLFDPPINASAGTPPEVGLIVKQNAAGQWMDDNGGDWTALVSGADADLSDRPVGWELIDNDVAIIDTSDNSVTYAEGLMNHGMAIAVHPTSGNVSLVGTDATNEIRFEPKVNGTFLRIPHASFHPSAPAATTSLQDLNPHLNYLVHTVPQATRDLALGDPRGIDWKSDGTRAFVTGMGSNNVVTVSAAGSRTAPTASIEVGEGPTGLKLDESRNRLYVLNRFEATISTIDLVSESEISRTALSFDPTPEEILIGRKHLYDTHKTSGLGYVSCASCHVDSRMDRLAWDLGDPLGDVKDVETPRHNLGGNFPGLNTNFTDFHPMKGPMTTQTLQDIIGKEPHHWRGDRDGIEEFNGAFQSLLGDDTGLTSVEMQEFEDYLATIYFPPNPFRNLDNTLKTSLPLPGHFKTGRFGGEGTPLPSGDPDDALDTIYRPLNRGIDRGVFACVTCHTLPIGNGTDTVLSGLSFSPLDSGPKGERHHALVSVDGSSQRAIKIPQLRNLYDKVGFDTTQMKSRAGFGFAHDGSVDSIARFMSEGAFEPDNDQQVADLVALMISFSGSEFGTQVDVFEPPGTASLDVPASVGKQESITSGSATPVLTQLLALADAGKIEVVARAAISGEPRGWLYTGSNNFDSDQMLVSESLASLLGKATASSPIVFTAVPLGCGNRMGIDRDRDGLFDYDEIRDFSLATPGIQNPFDPANPDSSGDNGNNAPDGILDELNDFDGDGISNIEELQNGSNPVDNLDSSPPLNVVINTPPTLDSVDVTWMTQSGAIYEIEYTHDMIMWLSAGDGSIPAPPGGGQKSWTDDGPPATNSEPASVPRRFYRVRRTQ